jgi:hypothetical protein
MAGVGASAIFLAVSTETQNPPPELLEVVANLARFHREHEKFYAQSPLRDAVDLEAHSRVLKALAGRWEQAAPAAGTLPSPFAGSEDLNAPGLTAESGVLFMDGEGEPAEIGRMKEDLERLAASLEQTGGWLGEAMDQAWQVLGALVAYPSLAGVLGERHQIVISDSLAAAMQKEIGRLLRRSLDLLAQVDFAPAALREDLAGAKVAPDYLLSASELLDRAADLLAESATLVHGNDRRWRLFSRRVGEILDQAAAEPRDQ